MAKILFVHGTGVREPSYSMTFRTVQAAVNHILPGWLTYRCYWGETCGARLHGEGLSIPGYATARAIDDSVTEEEQEIVLWELLFQDPFYELRSLAVMHQETDEELAPNETPRWQLLLQKIE
jgi:hypothetical protein